MTKEDETNLGSFRIDNTRGKGLEIYLKEMAVEEEKSNNARTYLVRDTVSQLMMHIGRQMM